MNVKRTSDLEPGDVARLEHGGPVNTWRIIQKVNIGHHITEITYLRCVANGDGWKVFPRAEHGSYDSHTYWDLAPDGDWTIK